MDNKISKPIISRDFNFNQKVIFVDGQPGCGKTMLSSILSSLKNVELNTFLFELEFICRLYYLKKIDEDAVNSLIKMLVDFKLYNSMMGREVNFRYSDISSAFNDPNALRYFKRIFQSGDETIPAKIKKTKPILNIASHDLLGMSEPIFKSLGDKVTILEVIRHPLYMLIQQTLNFERLQNNPRDVQINISYNNKELPYYTYGWEELFLDSNSVERAIYTMNHCINFTQKAKNFPLKKYKDQVITIPFENFVLNPDQYVNKITEAIGVKHSRITKKTMKKQKVPREKISDGIPLKIYKRCGWVPPDRKLTEKEELEKRREFAFKSNASSKSLKVLDALCKQYESKIWRPE